PAVEADEVARPRVHRESCLGREVAVVTLDQVVHRGEAPAGGELAPGGRELRGILELLRERPPRLAELTLVLVERVFNGAQPAHPGGRPAERPDAGFGIRTEVAEPRRDRLAAHRARREVGLDGLAV